MEEEHKILEKHNWEIVCESPFEIEHKNDPQSTATGIAAWIVLDYFREAEKEMP